MASDRVRQFVAVAIAESTKAMQADLVEEIRESVREELLFVQQETRDRLDMIDKRMQERAEQTDKWISALRERESRESAEKEKQVEVKKSRWNIFGRK